tara:strand:+ start:72 stop:197 length:126 start_codon:yes stop_codon:yes gene_type:complete
MKIDALSVMFIITDYRGKDKNLESSVHRVSFSHPRAEHSSA